MTLVGPERKDAVQAFRLLKIGNSNYRGRSESFHANKRQVCNPSPSRNTGPLLTSCGTEQTLRDHHGEKATVSVLLGRHKTQD